MANAIASQVQELYVGYLGRAADQAGLDFWTNAITAGTSTIESVALGFTLSQEYTSKYEGLSSEELAAAIYENVLGRAADADGLAFWVGELEKGVQTPETLLAAMLNSLGTVDQQVISNKVFVANAYTAAAGADYKVEAGAKVLEGVTADTATVSVALATIGNGTLPGGVPGLSLIKAIAAANDAVTAYGKTAASTNASFDADKNGSVSAAEANTALSAAQGDRALVVNGGTSTIATLEANVTNATNDLAAAKAAATAVTGGAAAIAAYDNAVAVDTAAKAADTANAAASAAAVAGLQTAVTATGATVTLATLGAAASTTFADANAVLAFLGNTASSASARAALVTELNKVVTYGAEVVKAGDLDLAAAKAAASLLTATGTLVAIDSDTTAPGSEGQDYIDDQAALALATTTLANAKTADEKVAAAKAVVDQYTALNKAVVDANTALNTFETANSAKVDIQALSAAVVSATADAAGTKSDVFYFSAGNAASVNDGTIANFGEGDSFVIGSGLTYNSGELTAGDNNKLEFFLIQKNDDVQLIIETKAFGSADAVTTSASAIDNAAVITLTGVNVADLAINDGVISYI